MKDRRFARLTAVGLISIAGAVLSAQTQVAPAPPDAMAIQKDTAPPAASTEAKPKLGGVWKLNAQLSDPPRRVPGPDDPGDDGQGGGFRPRPGGGGGYGGRSGGGGVTMGGNGGRPGIGGGGMPMDPEKMKQMRALLDEVMELPASLTISETADSVTFVEPDGRARTYKTNGRTEKHQATNGTVETRTRWEEGGLVVETDLGSGFKLARTYSVTGDPRQLTVLLKVEGGRGSRQRGPRRAIYDDTTGTTAAEPR